MNRSNDRADATVWLPILHILGGIAERVAKESAATRDKRQDEAREAAR